MVNDIFFSLSNITCGVPQGSILGRTLILIYNNDLTAITRFMDPMLYADDTNLLFKSKDLNSHVNVVNSELELVKNWCNRNKLTLNLSKTSY